MDIGAHSDSPYPSSSSFLAGLASVSWHGQGHQAGLRHYGRYHCPSLTPQLLDPGPHRSGKHTAHSPAAVSEACWVLLTTSSTPRLWVPRSASLMDYPWISALDTRMFSRQGRATHRACLLPLATQQPQLDFEWCHLLPSKLLASIRYSGVLIPPLVAWT